MVTTTRRGIGPAFADKAARQAIRAADLLDGRGLQERLAPILELKNAIITKVYGKAPLNFEEVYTSHLDYGRRLQGYIRETHLLMQEALAQGQAEVRHRRATENLMVPLPDLIPYLKNQIAQEQHG